MVVSKKSAYEESRQKRLEENKKRMEELNLNKLSQALHTQKPSPMKKVKPRVQKQHLDNSVVRRSSRVKELPPRSYKKVGIEPMGRRPRSYGHSRRDLSNRVYASDDDREYAIQRAEDLQSGLDQDVPSFVKSMLQSHVTGGFWMGLPVTFCKSHLPRKDAAIILFDENGVTFCKSHLPRKDAAIILFDENGEESETKYYALKTGLSAGWRGFALDHELVDGDTLVFQLIDPTTFKVYIIRVNEKGDTSD